MVIVYRSRTAFNCSRCVIALNQVSFLFLASELLLLFETSHTMPLQFTFDIFYGRRFMSNRFIYSTVAVSAGAPWRALCRGTGARARPRGAAAQLDVLPSPWQVPRSPPRGTELSGDLADETRAGIAPWLIKHQEDFG